MVIMNKFFIMTIIVIITVTIIGSSSLTSVLAEGEVTIGPANCEEFDTFVKCCAVETGSDGIEITYCTMCDNTNPPSNCGPRGMENPDLPLDTSTPDGKDIDKDQVLSPPKSNEGSSQKNGMNPQQALPSSKSN